MYATKNDIRSLVSLLLALAIACVPFGGTGARWLKLLLVAVFVLDCLWRSETRIRTALFYSAALIVASIVPALTLWNAMVIPSLAFAIVGHVWAKPLDAQSWLLSGRPSPVGWTLVLTTIPLSAAGLLLWAHYLQPDLTKFRQLLPFEYGPLVVALGACGFALLNAAAEELAFRGILWAAMVRLGLHWQVTLFIQALFFGLFHYQGVPGGKAGVVLVFVWGLIQGLIRQASGGLLLPIISHVAADLTIIGLLLLLS